MNTRTEYEMTEKQLAILLDACKPVCCINLGAGFPSTPQENANRAWAVLGEEMGFEPMSVEPSSAGQRFFSAVPTSDDIE